VRAIWIIATNTFREIIRDRVLYGIVVFALLLIGVSLALGELSFAEQARISANFGFTGIQLSASILAIFVGSSLVAKEIEKQTILTLLARPITRSQFLVGKFFGLILVIGTVMFGLGAVLAVTVHFLKLVLGLNFLIALYGVMLEALILTSIALFFGSFSRPIMTVIFTASLFLIGHWISSLSFFIEKSQSMTFKTVSTIIQKILPDLERFNWRSGPIYDTTVSAGELAGTSVYALGWIVLLIAATTLIFRRRDFV
jgi:Cu-processing system permease protein